MAGMNPSIVSASLDDKQLRDSISNLVNTVKKQTDKMANDFDSAIEKMNKSLKKLGAVGASSGGDATDTSKVKQNTQAVEENTAARKKNAQAAKEQKMTLDQMAQAQQQVTAPKSARESYYAFQQGFKAQAQKIAQQIKDAEAALNASVLRRTEELTSKLTVAKQRLNELNIELSKQRMEAEKTGNYSNYNAGISRTQQAIEYQMRRIAELQRQISEVSPNMFTEQVQKIGILRSEYERISNIMKDEATASQQQLNLTDAQKQKLSELESQYARLKKEREEASKAYQEAGWQRFGAKIQAGAYPNDPNVQKQLADAEEKLRVATERLNKVKAEQAQLDKEISAFKNTLSASTKQNTQSQQQATIAASKYTDEIKKQAQAIRESQQWKEKGYATVGDRSYYDPDRSNMAKKERLSLEEQILKTITEQQTAEQQVIVTENAVTESAKEEARIREMMRQGIVATNEALEKARSLSTKGIGVTIGDKDGTVNTFTTKLESAKRLSEELKKLKTQYDNLDLGQRKGNEAQNIAIKIREITRQVQILSRELNRPTKKEIAGLSEKTLDDISYKMKQLQAYRQGIDLTKPNAAAEIKQVDSELQRLQKDADKWMSKQKSMIEGNNALGRSWNYMKNRLAFYFTVGASTQFVRQLVEVRSQYEMNERALGILIDSAERGTQIFKELSQMSLVSPYTLIELSTAAKQLTAYDIAAKDVVDTTRRLADMAAAVGIPIERLTYALGQIKAYGYLNSRDARMFSNAGIPLVKQMADYYSQLEGQLVSTADVYDRIKKKQIDFEEVVAVINHMTDEGGKFFDFQAKMADTLKVQLANLTLAWNNMLNDMGSDNQGVLSGGIKMLKEMFLRWRDIERVMTDVVVVLGFLKAAQLLSMVMFGKGTLAAIQNAAAMKGVTAANYTSILSTKKLTAEQAKLLVAMNKGNVGLIQAISGLKVLSTAEINAANNASILKTAWIGVRAAMSTAEAGMAALSATLTAIAPQIAIFAAIGAIVDFGQMLKERYDRTKEFNENLVRNTKESTESISKYLENITYGDATKLTANDQEKAWERVREEIEMSTAAAERYISALEKEQNVGKRINSANDILRKVAEIHGMMSEWHKDDIKITQDFKILGIGADGLSTDLEDFLDAYHTAIRNSTEDVELNINATNSLGDSWERVMSFVSKWGEFFMHGMNIPVIEEISETLSAINPAAWVQKWLFGGESVFGKIDGVLRNEVASAQIELNELNDEVDELVESLVKKLRKEGVSDPLKIREALEKTLQSAGYTGEQLETITILATRKMREEYHKLYSDVPKELDKALDSESSSVEAFFNFVKNRNSALLSNIAREDLQNGKWLTKERQKELDKYLMEFKKTHALAFEDLQKYVGKANKLSIYIPVYFGVAKTPEEVAKDFMERTGYLQGHKYYSEFVKDSASQVDIIQKVKKAQKEKQEQLDAAEKAGGKYWENNKDRLTQENNELIKIIHSYNALTDAEEKAKQNKKKDVLGDALQKEVQLITDIRKRYEELKKYGMNSTEALKKATDEYGVSLKNVKNKLAGFGIVGLEGEDVANMNMRDIVKKYQSMIEIAKLKGSEKGVEVLEKAIASLNVEITKLDYKKITEGLNNELGKLKDEYELSIDLEANPELGGIFADLIGIGDEQLKDLPKDFNSLLKKMQAEIDKSLGENRFNLAKNLNKSSFDKWLKANEIDVNSEQAKTLKAFVDYANKVRQDETKKQVSEWNKLLEKYAEYETKKKQILDEYNREREIALKKNADERILSSIENRRNERIAELDFNEFMKTPEWVTATGNLAGMSKRAIDMLIDKINEYKKSAKYLSPKQIKQLNQALKQLHTEQKKNDPFKAISNMLAEASERMANFDDKIKETEKEIEGLQKKRKADIVDGIADEETNKSLKNAINRLKELKEAREKAGEIDASDWVNSINEVTTAFQGAVNVVNELAEAIGGFNNEPLKDAFSVIGKAGSAAAIGAAIGGGYGAAIGAVVGAATGVFSLLAGSSNGNIDKKIKRSEAVVESLTNSYKLLEEKIEDAYGAAEYGYKKAAIANKELQVIELKRQLQLEESRDSKDRDSEKIESLKGQIIDLEVEIRNATEDIVNDLLGISSVGDAAEQLVSSMIDSFKNGEDYMKVFQNSFDDMVDNMIMKAIVGKIIGERIEAIYEKVKENAEKRAGDEDYTFTTWNDHEKTMALNEAIEYIKEKIAKANETNNVNKREYWEKELEKANAAYANAMTPTPQDVKDISSLTEGFKDDVKSEFEAWMDAFGIAFGQDSTKSLSALQQGIQGITEDTAGALEAYMNGVSQQVYQQTEYLRQIAEVMNRDDDPTDDVKVASLSQILLQLRSSYEMQTAIHSIIDSWNGQSTAYACNVRIVP